MQKCPKCGYIEEKKNRSSQQNRYYHGIVLERLSLHIGYTPDEMHEVLKHKFLRTWRTIPTKTGPEEIEITRSTTELTTKDFEEYMTQVREWASINLGCWIPEPNEAECNPS